MKIQTLLATLLLAFYSMSSTAFVRYVFDDENTDHNHKICDYDNPNNCYEFATAFATKTKESTNYPADLSYGMSYREHVPGAGGEKMAFYFNISDINQYLHGPGYTYGALMGIYGGPSYGKVIVKVLDKDYNVLQTKHSNLYRDNYREMQLSVGDIPADTPKWIMIYADLDENGEAPGFAVDGLVISEYGPETPCPEPEPADPDAPKPVKDWVAAKEDNPAKASPYTLANFMNPVLSYDLINNSYLLPSGSESLYLHPVLDNGESISLSSSTAGMGWHYYDLNEDTSITVNRVFSAEPTEADEIESSALRAHHDKYSGNKSRVYSDFDGDGFEDIVTFTADRFYVTRLAADKSPLQTEIFSFATGRIKTTPPESNKGEYTSLFATSNLIKFDGYKLPHIFSSYASRYHDNLDYMIVMVPDEDNVYHYERVTALNTLFSVANIYTFDMKHYGYNDDGKPLFFASYAYKDAAGENQRGNTVLSYSPADKFTVVKNLNTTYYLDSSAAYNKNFSIIGDVTNNGQGDILLSHGGLLIVSLDSEGNLTENRLSNEALGLSGVKYVDKFNSPVLYTGRQIINFQ